jgi:HEAT repeat protein
MAHRRLFLLLSVALLAASAARSVRAADDDAKARAKAVRDYAKAGGSEVIPKLATYSADPDVNVRLEAVKGIVAIGTESSLDPLVKFTADNDPEIQIRATDGLVNFYLPGYVSTGLTASIKRVGTSIKGKFTDTNDQVIDAYIHPRPEIITALGKLVRGGANMDSRANAARAVGVLRGREAVPDLEDALHSKNSALIYESLVALEKIRDQSAGPRIAFLLRDFDKKVQIAAIEATGLLANRSAMNDLRDVLDKSKNNDVKRAALTAMSQMPEPSLHGVFTAYLDNKDEGLRQGAAEGLGRLKNPADRAALESAFSTEQKTGARLSIAFALVSLGKLDAGEFDPLRYLVNNLNSVGYKGVARPYLVELARDPQVRAALYPLLTQPAATKDEKIGLAQVLASSGADDSLQPLESLSKDPDADVAQEALRSLKTLRSRN